MTLCSRRRDLKGKKIVLAYEDAEAKGLGFVRLAV